MPEQVTFKCLRCGNEWLGILDTDIERMCPKCRSNSARRVKEAPRQRDKEARGQAEKAKG